MSEVVRASGTVWIDGLQFLVAEERQPFLDPPPPPCNGIMSIIEGCAVIYTSASSGLVNITVEALAEGPTVTMFSDWDEVVEADLLAPAGNIVVRSLMAPPPDLPRLSRSGPGNYRIRVCARGRDINPDAVAFEPVEDYLVQVWPDAPTGEVVLKSSDTYGANLRLGVAHTTAQAAEHTSSRKQPPRKILRMASEK